MSTLFRLPKAVAIDGSGVPYAGAKANFYLTGTTTPTNTYTDAALTTPSANPVVADAGGVFAPIYLDPDVTYKLTLTQSDDTLIYTVDPVNDALTAENLGAILYARTNAESNAGVAPDNYQYPAGDTRRYPNGITDAIAQAVETDGVPVLFAESESISTGVSLSGDNIVVKRANKAVLTYTGTGTAVTIGTSGSNSSYCQWDVPIRRTQEWDDGTDTTSIGLQLRRVRYATITADIEGFNYGLNLYGITGGNVHNDIRIEHLQDNRIQIRLERDGGSAGWSNSNYFHSGRIGYRSSTGDTAASNAVVVKFIEQAHASDNDNKFDAIGCEYAGSSSPNSSSVFYELNGQWNSIVKCRIESITTGFTQFVRFGASSIYNVVDAGRFPTAITTANFVSDGAGSNSTNRVLYLNSTLNYGLSTRMRIAAVAAIGRPSSSLYGGDAAYDANFVSQNLVSAANKVYAGLDGSSNVIFGVTGNGRMAVGKDPAANLGHWQLVDEGITDKTKSVNETTWERTTTDDTPATINFDSVTIPDNSATFVELTGVIRSADGTTVWAEKRTGLISKDGTSNALVEDQSSLAAHDPDTFGGSLAIKVTGAQLQIEVTGEAATTYQWTGTIRWQSITAAS